MVELYPALVAMYRRLGANGLAGQFLLSAGSTCGFLSEPGRAIEHYREAAREFGSAGPPTGRAEALRRLEPLLHDKTNAMLSNGHLNEAIPWLIELADTAGELGHGQLRATSQINAAIAMLHTTEQIAEALALAEAAFAECLPESGEAQRAARTIELCRQRLSTGVLAPGGEVS
jgi:hypothetical protein